jgi:uncharacterized protein (DUF885 family)
VIAVKSSISRWVAALAALGYAVGASAQGGDAAQRVKAFDALLAEQWQHQLEDSPESATTLGDLRYNDRWSDISVLHAQRERQIALDFLKRFEAIDSTGFPDEEALNRQLMMRQLRDSVRSVDLKLYEMPLDYHHGIQLQLPGSISSIPFDNTKEYDDYLARLKAIPHVLQQATEVARQGMRDGMVPPRYLLEKVAAQIEGIGAPAGLDNAFAAPLKHFPKSVSAADQSRLRAAMVQAIDHDVRPAYRRLAQFVSMEYAPHGRSEPGIWQLPHGDEIYRFAVEQMTTTKETPEQIFKLGLSEVDRIEAEMTVIAMAQGYPDLSHFRAALDRDPNIHARSREDILNRYRAFIAQMQPQLPKLFGLLPKTALQVVPVEAYRENGFQLASYQQGTPDGSRPGLLYVNTGNFASRTTMDIESVAYHEGIPGHHLQISVAQALPGLPPFRQQADYTAYIEGWALYAERLGKEMGFYQDPLSDYGRLTGELWRADRLVLDTGVHYKHWTRQQMVDYFRAHSSVSESDIQSETDRYITWPGQALAYKVGQLKLLQLRSRAQQALGGRFDLRAFHDEILRGGALPLDVLEARVDAWIDAQRNASSTASAGARPAPMS